MTRAFIQTNEFSKNWDILGFDDEDLRLLELSILEHPEKYPIMKGTVGFEKPEFLWIKKGKVEEPEFASWILFWLRRYI